MLSVLLVLGLANWLATTIIVESEFCRPLREWVENRAIDAFNERRVTQARFFEKLHYLVGCHLCAGTWVGFALTAASGVRLAGTGVSGFIITSLAVKAVGHLVLEAAAWLKRSWE